jgi:hypothetical protein
VELDRQYHRSKPVVIGTDDPGIMIYVHRGANPDGSGDYVELAELEEPIVDPWYLNAPHGADRGVEINMDLVIADHVYAALSALRAV